VDVYDIDAARDQDDQHEAADDLLVSLINRIGERLEVLRRNGLAQRGDDRHHQKTQAADPEDRRHEVQPMVHDRDPLIDERRDEEVHQNLKTDLSLPKRALRSSSINSGVILVTPRSRALASTLFLTMACMK